MYLSGEEVIVSHASTYDLYVLAFDIKSFGNFMNLTISSATNATSSSSSSSSGGGSSGGGSGGGGGGSW